LEKKNDNPRYHEDYINANNNKKKTPYKGNVWVGIKGTITNIFPKPNEVTLFAINL
jgi:uncharacterized membrane protein YcgQ (UPF0703/DUF1980 family)